jgi:hypothetical protein
MELAYALVGEQLDLGDDICGAGKGSFFFGETIALLTSLSQIYAY